MSSCESKTVSVRVSAGVITCNEEQTIGPLIDRLSESTGTDWVLAEIIVVSAECRDRTDALVRQRAARDSRIRLITEPVRRGKSAAVNTFLHERSPSDLTLLASGDVLPDSAALSHLGAAFQDPSVGMAGGRPVPINPPDSFVGRMAHLMWQWHHEISLEQPKLGELVVFRSALVPSIPEESPVDEASIEAAVLASSSRLRYVPEARIANRGPETLREWLSQRRRIAFGHAWLSRQSRHRVATGNLGLVLKSLGRTLAASPSAAGPAAALVVSEVFARLAARFDFLVGRRHKIWNIARSTKGRLDE